jgi:hypothetical protein
MSEAERTTESDRHIAGAEKRSGQETTRGAGKLTRFAETRRPELNLSKILGDSVHEVRNSFQVEVGGHLTRTALLLSCVISQAYLCSSLP